MSSGFGDFGDSFGGNSGGSGSGGNGGAGGGTNVQGASSSTMDYSRLTSVVASNTKKIETNNKEIQKLTQLVGTEQDNAQVRDQLQQKQQITRKQCKDTERFLKELKDLPHPEQESEKRQRRVMLTKLANAYSNGLNEFQKAQREILEKQKIAMRNASQQNQQENATLINMEQTPGQVQVQQQLSPEEYAAMQDRENAIAQLEVSKEQQQEQLELQAMSPAERELREAENKELAQLETDINTMAEVFTEVSKLVHEQGEHVDSIEQNIEDGVGNIQQGNTHLRQAREHQRSARKKKFIIAGVCLIAILVLFLIIWFSLPQSNNN